MPVLSGKTALVTGANTGIGFETALALYEAGAHVILACRNSGLADQALHNISQRAGKGTLETGLLDLASLDAVKGFAAGFLTRHKQLHILINNAGVMVPPPSKTAEGFELQFGVNFIGHFALTGLLYPLLKSTPGARVVTVSSMAYLRGSIGFNNLHSEQSYDAAREYSQSKLADVLFSLELHRRILSAGDGVLSIAAQPGANKTELSRNMSEAEFAAGVERVGGLMDPWQGALPSLYAAVSQEAAGGQLYEPDQGGYRGYPALATLAPNALDAQVARQLWELAEKATDVQFP